MSWDGKRWDGMRCDGMGWDEMGWDEMQWHARRGDGRLVCCRVTVHGSGVRFPCVHLGVDVSLSSSSWGQPPP